MCASKLHRNMANYALNEKRIGRFIDNENNHLVAAMQDTIYSIKIKNII